MATLSSDTQLEVYSLLRCLETRELAIEQLIQQLKQRCLGGGSGTVAELVPMMTELRHQLRDVAELAGQIETSLGMDDAATGEDPAPSTTVQTGSIRAMRGTTEVLPVPDLVSTLSVLHKTGTLTLQDDETMFVFELQEGKVVHAVTNKRDPNLRLGTILVANNNLTEEQLQECLDASAAANEMLGGHLVKTATVSEEDLRAALDTQVHRIFEEAFALEAAQFTFHEGSLSNIAQRTAVNTTGLLLEAARQRDHAVRDAQAHSLDSVLDG